uniref:SUN domain-containing protein n=1 Tax=Alexandrium andersonii TaxID=327968 RepID=A0A7S2MGX5_9DINO|mmetsp:Transcript_68601/g.153725  ORF Transcript_68601/g.153725 Transcript_68601/m.153725 type:complete len:174 (+) Transcript_68601:2-523(+)
MLVKYYGLETFMYGDVGQSGNIFERIAELSGVNQSKLQTAEAVRIILSSTGGVPAPNHEEVLGPTGFHERSLENSYGAHPNTITIKFLKHRVRVEAMEMRAKVADIVAHMSNNWTFRHGSESIQMTFTFSRVEPETGRLETGGWQSFADEVGWTFPRDFCLEHIVLYGRVMAK